MKRVEDLVTEQTKMERQSHMDLSEPCIERGGNSTNHKGVLAQYLDTNIPYGIKYPLCHGCHNGKCSNPKHLYWGTPKENVEDSIENGTKYSKGRKPEFKDSEETKLKKSLAHKGISSPKYKWDDKKLLLLKKQGLSNVKIGKTFGVTESAVRKRLKKIYSPVF